jgi:hypothetical protein
MIESGYFEYCMMVLIKNMKFNNLICSSMLENMKILKELKRFTPYHRFIQ